MATIAAQRNLANSFHLSVDELEGIIKSATHPSKEELDRWSQSLAELRTNFQAKRDDMKIIADKVYDMIFKSATSKCNRLEADVIALFQST